MKTLHLTPQEVKDIMNELGRMPLSVSINLYRFFETKINHAAKKEQEENEPLSELKE